MKRIAMSVSAILFVAALSYGATGAFFSDTETSTGNTFTAGAIDLLVDSEAHYAGLFCDDGFWADEGEQGGVTRPDLLGDPCSGTWAMTNLGPTNQFFNLGDLKPGDTGENTISLHVENNDAYVCAIVNNLADLENSITEPESDLNDTAPTGELSGELRFFAWADTGADDDFGDEGDTTEGDNIWQEGENPLFTNGEGPASDVLAGVSYPLFTPQTSLLPAGNTAYVGLYWCYGAITIGAGTLSCSGAPVSNDSQTDSMTADVSFYVEQARNNGNFTCPEPGQLTPDVNVQVGSNFALYQAPTCNVTVDGQNTALDTIQEAVNAAAAGQTVCVPDGTYNETVSIETPNVTLAAINPPGNTSTIADGVNIEADGVTVKGFVINEGVLNDGVVGAVYIKDMTDNILSNITVRDNDIAGSGTPGSRGIINGEGGTFDNILIENNDIHDWTSAIYLSTIAGSGNMIKWNDIIVESGTPGDTSGVGQLNNFTVTLNEFTSETANGEALGAGPDYDSSAVSQNNFLNGSEVMKYGVWPALDLNPPAIVAENNFWNTGAVNQTQGAVDYLPQTGAQYSHR